MDKIKNFNFLSIVILALVIVPGVGFNQQLWADSKPLAQKTYDELVQGAKEEKELFIWDTFTGVQSKVFDHFMKKYPFIKIKQTRMRSGDATERLIMEAKAGRKPDVDLNLLSAKDISALKEIGILMSFPWKKYTKVDPRAIEPDNVDVATHGLMPVLAYNSRLLSSDKLPRSYEDLLKPEFKGKVGLEIRAYIWTQLVATGHWSEEKGTEFVRKLLAQDNRFVQGGTHSAQLLIAGEFPISITYLDKVILFGRKGAPIKWIPIEPVAGFLQGRGIPKYARHPHSAILFVIWSVSSEGQKVLEEVTGKSLPFKGLDTEHSRLLGGKELALVSWGKTGDEMERLESKFMKIWGVK